MTETKPHAGAVLLPADAVAQIRAALGRAYNAIAGQDNDDRQLEGAELEQARLEAMAACVKAMILLGEQSL